MKAVADEQILLNTANAIVTYLLTTTRCNLLEALNFLTLFATQNGIQIEIKCILCYQIEAVACWYHFVQRSRRVKIAHKNAHMILGRRTDFIVRFVQATILTATVAEMQIYTTTEHMFICCAFCVESPYIIVQLSAYTTYYIRYGLLLKLIHIIEISYFCRHEKNETRRATNTLENHLLEVITFAHSSSITFYYSLHAHYFILFFASFFFNSFPLIHSKWNWK